MCLYTPRIKGWASDFGGGLDDNFYEILVFLYRGS